MISTSSTSIIGVTLISLCLPVVMFVWTPRAAQSSAPFTRAAQPRPSGPGFRSRLQCSFGTTTVRERSSFPRYSEPMVHIPILRKGAPYRSLDTVRTPHYRTRENFVEISIANVGLIRRDLLDQRTARESLASLSTPELIAVARH